jgi:hypothetical protein
MARASGLTRLVTGFLVVESAPVSLAQPKTPTVLEEVPPALLAWGDASDFLLPTGQIPGIIHTRNIPPGDFLSRNWDDQLEDFDEQVEDYEEEEVPPILYHELTRTVSVVRVENPEDPAQYVDVERIETITFRGPDRDVQFILNHAAQTVAI